MNVAREVSEARNAEILRELCLKQKVYTTDLSDRFGVSPMTIRRALDHLEKKGKLERFHGGAQLPVLSEGDAENPDSLYVPATSDAPILPLLSKVQENISAKEKQKDMIARFASRYIEPCETIFLNSGTTGLYLLRYLAGKNVRVISNNAAIALVERPLDTELMISGGEHFARTQSYVGPLAKTVFMNVIATKCFLSCSGISSQNGITCSSMQETEINNLMIERCHGKRIVIADGSKVGAAYSFISCQVTDVDMLITDMSADADELDRLRECGITVVVVDAEENDGE